NTARLSWVDCELAELPHQVGTALTEDLKPWLPIVEDLPQMLMDRQAGGFAIIAGLHQRDASLLEDPANAGACRGVVVPECGIAEGLADRHPPTLGFDLSGHVLGRALVPEALLE